MSNSPFTHTLLAVFQRSAKRERDECIDKLREVLRELGRHCGGRGTNPVSMVHSCDKLDYEKLEQLRYPFARKGAEDCYERLRRKIRNISEKGRNDRVGIVNFYYSLRLDPLAAPTLLRCGSDRALLESGLPLVASKSMSDGKWYGVVLLANSADANGCDVVAEGRMLPLATPEPSIEYELDPNCLRLLLLCLYRKGKRDAWGRTRNRIRDLVRSALGLYARPVIESSDTREEYTHLPLEARSVILRLPTPVLAGCSMFPFLLIVRGDIEALRSVYLGLASYIGGLAASILALTPRSIVEELRMNTDRILLGRYAILDEERGVLAAILQGQQSLAQRIVVKSIESSSSSAPSVEVQLLERLMVLDYSRLNALPRLGR